MHLFLKILSGMETVETLIRLGLHSLRMSFCHNFGVHNFWKFTILSYDTYGNYYSYIFSYKKYNNVIICYNWYANYRLASGF